MPSEPQQAVPPLPSKTLLPQKPQPIDSGPRPEPKTTPHSGPRWLLIHPPRVLQIERERFPVHPSLIWLDVSDFDDDDETLLNATFENDELVIHPPEPPPAIIPPPISRRQFYQALAMKQLITTDEALAAVQHGAIPQLMEDWITGHLNAEEAFAARMLLAGASEFQRDHELVYGVASAAGLTSEQIDEIWRLGQTL